MLDPCARQVAPAPFAPDVKGDAVTVFARQNQAALSDVAVDCTQYNAVSLSVYVSGTNPSATLTVKGAAERGGIYLPLVDPNSSKTVTSSQMFDVLCGAAWVRVELSSVSGSYAAGQGYTIVVTPYVAPGPTALTATVT